MINHPTSDECRRELRLFKFGTGNEQFEAFVNKVIDAYESFEKKSKIVNLDKCVPHIPK